MLSVPQWLWNHKFKVVFLLVLIYISRRCWLIYKQYVKPFLDIGKMMKGDASTKNSNSANSKNNANKEDDILNGIADLYYDEVDEEE